MEFLRRLFGGGQEPKPEQVEQASALESDRPEPVAQASPTPEPPPAPEPPTDPSTEPTPGHGERFQALTLEEKRSMLDLTEFYLQSVLKGRSGDAQLVEVGLKHDYVERMTDEDIQEAIELSKLQTEAMVAAEGGGHREAIEIYERILVRAPFDSISMLSIGVSYAYLGDGPTAVRYVEQALESDPGNERIRDNLEGIRQHFGL